jgi:pimeloyl-ACP methyl ester carboxylesterase
MEAEFIDQNRAERVIRTLICYPADSAGLDVPPATSTGEGFPIIVFGHGYLMPVDAYRNIWECTVPEGFITVLPESGSNMFPSHMEFGKDMAFLLEEMVRLAGDPQSAFYGRIKPYGCLMGHSMGGGAAILGSIQCNLVRTLLVLAPLDTRPSSAEAARELTVPTLVFAGTDDCITPPKKHQVPIYESLQSSHKLYISIKGGSHCQMAEDNRLCNFAEASFDLEPGISREEQHRILNRYIIPWLRFYLYDDPMSGLQFDKELESDPSVSFQRKGDFGKEKR